MVGERDVVLDVLGKNEGSHMGFEDDEMEFRNRLTSMLSVGFNEWFDWKHPRPAYFRPEDSYTCEGDRFKVVRLGLFPPGHAPDIVRFFREYMATRLSKAGFSGVEVVDHSRRGEETTARFVGVRFRVQDGKYLSRVKAAELNEQYDSLGIGRGIS